MRLYLIRHATAVPHGTPDYPDDAQRPLTDEGVAEARQVGKGLKRLKLDIHLVVTSPYLRARQTAEEVARIFGLADSIEELDELRSEVKPSETSQALKRLSKREQVLFVGHEPHLSGWIAELVADHGKMNCLMKKAAVACVEIERIPPPQGSGTLRWLMTPKHLSLIGRV